jgi:GTPase
LVLDEWLPLRYNKPFMNDTSPVSEKAVLIGIITFRATEQQVNDYLDELEFLLETAGAIPAKRFVQRLDNPDSRTFVGSGKLQEIAEYVKAEKIDAVVCDDELSPSQIRNLEKALECKIMDRTALILDIFAHRARTTTAKTQVELAQYEYMLPRLTRMWTHLTKQRGGMGMRGPGEKEIETDRRIIREKIIYLKDKLKTIDKQKITQRKSREDFVRVALVGYTNAGKSTLMNLLSKSDVFAENKLFATLDTTVRKMVIENLPFLLTDTVGFIRKLPHHLVESFKSTLDEVREADLLLHIVDISHPGFEEQINVVKQTLSDMKVGDKPVIMVFNKIDAFPHVEIDPYDLTITNPLLSLEELKNTWMAKANTPAVFISAKQKLNINDLRSLLYEEVKKVHVVRYPYNSLLY